MKSVTDRQPCRAAWSQLKVAPRSLHIAIPVVTGDKLPACHVSRPTEHKEIRVAKNVCVVSRVARNRTEL